MFTGLVQHVGQVASLDSTPAGAALAIQPNCWSHEPAPGDSIAVNGCCLTVTAREPGGVLRFDVIHQTLAVTTLGGVKPGHHVNLEHCATPTTLIGGHIVQGHIDGVATALRVAGQPGEVRIRVNPGTELMEYIVPCGSIAIDGVSLTLAEVGGDWFEVALIPSTLELTNLARIATQPTHVNLEVDYLIKAVIHHLGRQGAASLRD